MLANPTVLPLQSPWQLGKIAKIVCISDCRMLPFIDLQAILWIDIYNNSANMW